MSIVTTKISKSPSKFKRPRVLAVDECCNNLQIAELISEALKNKDVDGCFPIWDQARIREDGIIINVRGGYAEGGPPNMDWGKPLKHHSFPDERVVKLLEALTQSYDVIFLSENTKMNPNGVRKLLLNSKNIKVNSSIIAIYKKGKTNYKTYREELEKIIPNLIFPNKTNEIIV